MYFNVWPTYTILKSVSKKKDWVKLDLQLSKVNHNLRLSYYFISVKKQL